MAIYSDVDGSTHPTDPADFQCTEAAQQRCSEPTWTISRRYSTLRPGQAAILRAMGCAQPHYHLRLLPPHMERRGSVCLGCRPPRCGVRGACTAATGEQSGRSHPGRAGKKLSTWLSKGQ